MVQPTIGHIFTYEILGTAMLLLLGCGVVANVALTRTKGNGGGFLLVNFGWALGVYAGVYVAFPTGAHLNPAVTLSQLMLSNIDFGHAVAYWCAEMIGAFLGAVVCWLAYKQHFDDEPDPANKLGVFSTGPAIRSVPWNLVTEVIGTFVLIFVILVFGGTPTKVGPLAVALLVLAIGASLGGPTGYAINPARDLGPRIAHFVLPIKGKGSSDWGYSWIPVIGPLVGAAIAVLVFKITDADTLIKQLTSKSG
ncbi:MAG: aquaporin family protein [Actinomycetota bacterium]|nr:aquaporin family protein [Actinomycetota bacterium]